MHGSHVHVLVHACAASLLLPGLHEFGRGLEEHLLDETRTASSAPQLAQLHHRRRVDASLDVSRELGGPHALEEPVSRLPCAEVGVAQHLEDASDLIWVAHQVVELAHPVLGQVVDVVLLDVGVELLGCALAVPPVLSRGNAGKSDGARSPLPLAPRLQPVVHEAWLPPVHVPLARTHRQVLGIAERAHHRTHEERMRHVLGGCHVQLADELLRVLPHDDALDPVLHALERAQLPKLVVELLVQPQLDRRLLVAGHELVQTLAHAGLGGGDASTDAAHEPAGHGGHDPEAPKRQAAADPGAEPLVERSTLSQRALDDLVPHHRRDDGGVEREHALDRSTCSSRVDRPAPHLNSALRHLRQPGAFRQAGNASTHTLSDAAGQPAHALQDPFANHHVEDEGAQPECLLTEPGEEAAAVLLVGVHDRPQEAGVPHPLFVSQLVAREVGHQHRAEGCLDLGVRGVEVTKPAFGAQLAAHHGAGNLVDHLSVAEGHLFTVVERERYRLVGA